MTTRPAVERIMVAAHRQNGSAFELGRGEVGLGSVVRQLPEMLRTIADQLEAAVDHADGKHDGGPCECAP